MAVKLNSNMSPPSRRLQTKPVITCLKTFLISYSLIFWFTGVILLAVGVWGKVSLEAYFTLISEEGTNAPYVLIGTGAIIVIFGLFGCFATCRGSPWMLKLYAMFLTLVFLAELVAGVSGFIFRHEIKAKIGIAYNSAVTSYNGTDDKSAAVDDLQRKLHCCGKKNFTDWKNTSYFKENGIPVSCCKIDKCSPETLKDLDKAQTEVYTTGCFSLVTNMLEANLGVIAGVSFGIAFFQLIGIFLACCLSRYITNNQYEMV
ncbi:Tetraspanin-7 [Ataeniobius toweri]|uniref:Tetraspanin n=1 Tax=Ataeniobius toweri TaxID=208326 RepID=A0ABU7BW36_9TELE|nr:Tetraspanin-7 [Ataeniobius toweri]